MKDLNTIVEMNPHRIMFFIIALFLVYFTAPTAIYADSFSKGDRQISLTLGSGQLLNEDYIILGIGAGYYFMDGLEAKLSIDAWLDGDPSIYQVTPELNYVLSVNTKFNPFAGIFYRRNFIENYNDKFAYGYRIGFYASTGQRTYIGYNITYSKLQDCNKTVYFDCAETYSEINFGIGF